MDGWINRKVNYIPDSASICYLVTKRKIRFMNPISDGGRLRLLRSQAELPADDSEEINNSHSESLIQVEGPLSRKIGPVLILFHHDSRSASVTARSDH